MCRLLRRSILLMAAGLLGGLSDNQKAAHLVGMISSLQLPLTDPEWKDAILSLLSSPTAAFHRGDRAIELLVPEEDPMRLPDPDIDAVLGQALEFILSFEELDYGQERLRTAAVQALARRDRARDYWPLLLKAHHQAQQQGASEELAIRAALVQVVLTHEDLAPDLWFAMSFKDAHGRWNAFFLDAYAADLQLGRDELAQAATLDPDEPEGTRASSWVSHPQTLSGGFHLARQVVGTWSESDPATQRKMQIALGLRAIEKAGWKNWSQVLDRLQQQLSTALADVSQEERAELSHWVIYCRSQLEEKEPWHRERNDWLDRCQDWLKAPN